MKKEKKTKKEWVAIATSYLLGALALSCLFWMCRMYQSCGWEPFWNRSYIQTEEFSGLFRDDILSLESRLNFVFSYSQWEGTDYTEEDAVAALEDSWPKDRFNFRYNIRITYDDGRLRQLYNDQPLEDGSLKKDSPVYYRCLLNSPPETNVDSLDNMWFHVNATGKSQVEVTAWIDNFEQNDSYSQGKQHYEFYSKSIWPVMAVGMVSAVGLVGQLVRMILWERRKRQGMDRLYLEEQFLLLFLLEWILYLLFLSGNLFGFVLYFIFGLIPSGWLLFSTLRQLLTKMEGGWKRKSVVLRVLSTGGRLRNQALLGFLCYALWVLLGRSLVAWVLAGMEQYGLLSRLDWMWVFHAVLGLLLYLGLRHRLDQQELTAALEAVGTGQDKRDFCYKSKRYREIGRQVERMAGNIDRMVEENMKAERLKVDLITNVSHDLKTPLTSMIAYIRLLEKEGALEGKSKQYLSILSEKSLQLKRLTEDLLEAAKITSGNEKVCPGRLHFGEMVLQANGEFAEAMEQKQLTLVSNLQNEQLDAWIDGQKTWRILSNLYGNVCKYSMPGTRVYVDVAEQKGEIHFSMKNISKEPLNLPPDQLMERFVQGDCSRSSGGNGLGLAIAKDLAKLQGGSLGLEINGDLFCVELTLPAAPKEEKQEEEVV